VTERHGTQPELTDLQQAILDVLWTNGPATAEQVRAALALAHPLKDSSVRTLLRRLETRGYVTHRVDGKVFVYRAKVPRRSMAARAVQHIITRFCAGSVEQFLLGMVDENIVTADEIQRLAAKVRKSR